MVSEMRAFPRVTVVMPTYRHGDHIFDALRSLLHQNYKDWHLVIVCDGMPCPKTEAAIRAYEFSTEQRFDMVVLPDNRGAANALNVGFERGGASDYWTWVSSDNEMHPDWLARMVACLDAHKDLVAVYSAYNRCTGVMTDDGWVETHRVKMWQGQPTGPDWVLKMDGNCLLGPAFLWRRAACETVGAHRGMNAHDYDFWLRMEEFGPFLGIEDALCDYRVHDERAVVRNPERQDAMVWHAEARARRERGNLKEKQKLIELLNRPIPGLDP